MKVRLNYHLCPKVLMLVFVDSSSPFYPPIFKGVPPIPTGARNAIMWIQSQLPHLDPKDLLPLGIEVTKGAITCGNSSTPNLLVAEFQRTEGTFGIVQVLPFGYFYVS